ncbi:MAG: asparagine synthase (glutamine-hydrolyzing) [Acidobacteriota bacterium]|nr:asparagine synthase (glutamine-hydrolyzing) [Acidobacteriota bacterium]
MHDALAHRGPDGEGILVVDADLQAHCFERKPTFEEIEGRRPRFSAGFRWLKIQDLNPASSQPLALSDRSLWILLNGEIYNFGALREELQSLGNRFKTSGDAEVALAAYAQWGTTCFSRFQGMWAILIFDLRRRVMVGSRDRLGIKPMFFASDSQRLLFASEAQAIAAAQADGPHADPVSLGEFLRGLPPQAANRSFFQGVTPAPAGCYFELPLDAPLPPVPQFERYWTLEVARSGQSDALSYDETREKLEGLLSNSVRSHAVAAVGVGTLVSGGLDSSLLASLLAQQGDCGDVRPLAFSVVHEEPSMSEWPYIQLVLARSGLKGASVRLTRDTALEAVDKVVRALGRPLLGQDMIAQYKVYELARQNSTTVVLDGQGADELLAGLLPYEAQVFIPLLKGAHFVKIVRELRLRSSYNGNGFFQNAKDYLWSSLLGRRFASLLPGKGGYDWLHHPSQGREQPQGGRPPQEGITRLSQFLCDQVVRRNLPTVLVQQDHNSMAHAVESRVPYLDHRIVELCFQMPDSFKVGGGRRKRILRDIAEKYLPQAVWDRRDKRMFISRSNWIDLRSRPELLRELAHPGAFRELPVDAAGASRFVTQYAEGRHDATMAVWRLFTASRWLQLFRITT